jgi:hypothetical protein
VKAEPRSQFVRWLIHQVGRPESDPIGVFARIAAVDFRFPVEADNLDIVRFHLRTWDDPTEAEELFVDVVSAWKSYRNERRRIDVFTQKMRREVKEVERKKAEQLQRPLTMLERRKIRLGMGIRADWGLRVRKEGDGCDEP